MPEFGKHEVPLEGEKSQGKILEEAQVNEDLFSEAILPVLKLQQEMSREEAIEKIATERGFDKKAFAHWMSTLSERSREKTPGMQPSVRRSQVAKPKPKRKSKYSEEEIADMWFNKGPMA